MILVCTRRNNNGRIERICNRVENLDSCTCTGDQVDAIVWSEHSAKVGRRKNSAVHKRNERCSLSENVKDHHILVGRGWHSTPWNEKNTSVWQIRGTAVRDVGLALDWEKGSLVGPWVDNENPCLEQGCKVDVSINAKNTADPLKPNRWVSSYIRNEALFFRFWIKDEHLLLEKRGTIDFPIGSKHAARPALGSHRSFENQLGYFGWEHVPLGRGIPIQE